MSLTIKDCTITADSDDSAIDITGSDITISGCTFVPFTPAAD